MLIYFFFFGFTPTIEHRAFYIKAKRSIVLRQ
nr:MAG TPA: hypothetical protein [Caudoviricetes sp.]